MRAASLSLPIHLEKLNNPYFLAFVVRGYYDMNNCELLYTEILAKLSYSLVISSSTPKLEASSQSKWTNSAY